MSYAELRLEKLERASAEILAKADRVALEESLRLLAVYCAEFRAAHGNRSFDRAMGLLSGENLSDEETNSLAEGYELLIGIVGFAKHARASGQY